MDDQKLSTVCDQIVEIAAQAMVERGAAPELSIDRMLTYCAAQAASWHGSSEAAGIFRQLADRIEGGLFEHLTAPRTRVRQ